MATEIEDYSQPVLPGKGASDYERYLRTDELLSLQRAPEEQVHRDELLFQTVHQSSELWLKLACFEVEAATAHLRAHEPAPALRLHWGLSLQTIATNSGARISRPPLGIPGTLKLIGMDAKPTVTTAPMPSETP